MIDAGSIGPSLSQSLEPASPSGVGKLDRTGASASERALQRAFDHESKQAVREQEQAAHLRAQSPTDTNGNGSEPAPADEDSTQDTAPVDVIASTACGTNPFQSTASVPKSAFAGHIGIDGTGIDDLPIADTDSKPDLPRADALAFPLAWAQPLPRENSRPLQVAPQRPASPPSNREPAPTADVVPPRGTASDPSVARASHTATAADHAPPTQSAGSADPSPARTPVLARDASDPAAQQRQADSRDRNVASEAPTLPTTPLAGHIAAETFKHGFARSPRQVTSSRPNGAVTSTSEFADKTTESTLPQATPVEPTAELSSARSTESTRQNLGSAASGTPSTPTREANSHTDPSSRLAAIDQAVNRMTLRQGAQGQLEVPELGRVSVRAIQERSPEESVRIEVRAARSETHKLLVDHASGMLADVRAADLPVNHVGVQRESAAFDAGSRDRAHDDGAARDGRGEHGETNVTSPVTATPPKPHSPRRVRIVL